MALSYAHGSQRAFTPTTFDELWAVLDMHSDARFVVGGTDLSLEITKRFELPPTLVSLEGLPALKEVKDEGESALRLANAVTPGGTIVTYGAMSRQPLRIPNGLLIFKDLRWRGFWITPWSQRATPDESAAMFGELFALAQRGCLRSTVERLYSLDSCLEALAHANRSERTGKVLFAFDDSAAGWA